MRYIILAALCTLAGCEKSEPVALPSYEIRAIMCEENLRRELEVQGETVLLVDCNIEKVEVSFCTECAVRLGSTRGTFTKFYTVRGPWRSAADRWLGY